MGSMLIIENCSNHPKYFALLPPSGLIIRGFLLLADSRTLGMNSFSPENVRKSPHLREKDPPLGDTRSQLLHVLGTPEVEILRGFGIFSRRSSL